MAAAPAAQLAQMSPRTRRPIRHRRRAGRPRIPDSSMFPADNEAVSSPQLATALGELPVGSDASAPRAACGPVPPRRSRSCQADGATHRVDAAIALQGVAHRRLALARRGRCSDRAAGTGLTGAAGLPPPRGCAPGPAGPRRAPPGLPAGCSAGTARCPRRDGPGASSVFSSSSEAVLASSSGYPSLNWLSACTAGPRRVTGGVPDRSAPAAAAGPGNRRTTAPRWRPCRRRNFIV